MRISDWSSGVCSSDLIRCRVANARHHRICARRGQAPTNMIQTVVDAVLAGDRRIAGRLLSRAEAADPTITRDLQRLYRAGGKARMIGITGPPGTGKSTMVDQMVALYRAQDKRVAILAFDPSSPFSGGAVLGDRVRMLRHAEDAGVLIRSMAARGKLGGLAPAAGDALTILDARSEEHTSELQSLMRISYDVFCLKKKHTRPTKTNSAK